MIHPIVIPTNYGEITFSIWDTAGVDKYQGIKERYYIQSVGSILMYDAKNPNSFNSLIDYANKIHATCGGIECVIVASKCDIGVDVPFTEFDKVCISIKDDRDIFEPLVIMARLLTGHDDLVLLD